MYQRAPEGHEHRTYKCLNESAKVIVNTERYKTNRDRRQTTEYDFVPGPKRKNDSIKGAGEKHERKIKKREKDAKPPKKNKLSRVRHHYAYLPPWQMPKGKWLRIQTQ